MFPLFACQRREYPGRAMSSLPTSPSPGSVPRRRGRPARGAAGTGQVQSLSRALSLLEKIASADAGISLSVLAASVGLAASTTHRLLSTLEQHGFATLDAERGVWTIGVKAFTVGNAFLSNRDMVATARPFMRRLMEQSGESVNLAMLDRDEAVFLSQVECREMMRMMVALGGGAPLHASGAGKAQVDCGVGRATGLSLGSGQKAGLSPREHGI